MTTPAAPTPPPSPAVRDSTHSPVREPDAARLSALLDASPEAVAILDGQWRFLYVNIAFERMSRTSAATLVGRNVWDIYPGAMTEPFRERLREVMRDRRPASLEYVSPTGSSLEIQALPFGDGIAFFTRDITELRRAGAELLVEPRPHRSGLVTVAPAPGVGGHTAHPTPSGDD